MAASSTKRKNPIRQAREACQLTQPELAQKIKATKGAISKWENGNQFPRPAYAQRLVAALKPHLTLEAIYGQAA